MGADLEVMNRDAKKRLVISGWVDTQKPREHPKQFMILLKPPIILSNYSNTMWLGIWSLEPPINQPINGIMKLSFESFIESHEACLILAWKP